MIMMERNCLEYRLTSVFIGAVSSDNGDITEKEMNKLVEMLQKVYQELNIELDADSYLNDCFEDLNEIEEDQAVYIVTESIKYLKEFYFTEKLIFLTKAIYEVVGADLMSREERRFMEKLKEAWMVEIEEKTL